MYYQTSLEHDREYRSCFCLHVRTGTLMLGCLQFLVHLIVLGFLISHMVHYGSTSLDQAGLSDKHGHYYMTDPGMHIINIASGKTPTTDMTKKVDNMPNVAEFANSQESGKYDSHAKKRRSDEAVNIDSANIHPAKVASNNALGKSDINLPQLGLSADDTKQARTTMKPHNEEAWKIGVTVMSLIFTCLMVYGALFRQPSYLLPYFSIQVFDFILACFKVMGIFTYLPDYKHGAFGDDKNYKVASTNANHMNDINGPSLPLIALAFLILAGKAYLMCMVFSCYKYLVLQRRLTGSSPSTLNEAMRDVMSQARSLVTLDTTTRQRRFGLLALFLRRQPVSEGASGDLLTISTEEAALPPQQEPVELPKYEDLLEQPANANMPPPYFESNKKEIK